MCALAVCTACGFRACDFVRIVLPLLPCSLQLLTAPVVSACILYFSIVLTFAPKIRLSSLSILITYIICKTRTKSCKSEYKLICIRYSA